eukprot:scaffold5357_cov208-Amphora_coffeaeformis.AAC.9
MGPFTVYNNDNDNNRCTPTTSPSPTTRITSNRPEKTLLQFAKRVCFSWNNTRSERQIANVVWQTSSAGRHSETAIRLVLRWPCTYGGSVTAGDTNVPRISHARPIKPALGPLDYRT